MIDHLGGSEGDGFAVSGEGAALSFDAGGFSLADSEPSDDAFSPQPATSSAANSSRAFFIPDTYLSQAQGTSGERACGGMGGHGNHQVL